MNFPIIQQHDDLIQAVDAKELYQNLGLHNANWKRWHVSNIKENPFATEGVDYQGFIIMMSGNETQNYLLSIDFAKKLSMQVKTEKGEQVRDYFLECERKLKEPVPQLPTNYIEALEQLIVKEKALIEAAPKVDAYDRLIDSTHLKTVGDVAKSIGLRSAQALNDKLDTVKAYDGRCADRVWSGWFIEQGLGRMITTDKGYSSNKMTAKGQAWALDLFGID